MRSVESQTIQSYNRIQGALEVAQNREPFRIHFEQHPNAPPSRSRQPRPPHVTQLDAQQTGPEQIPVSTVGGNGFGSGARLTVGSAGGTVYAPEGMNGIGELSGGAGSLIFEGEGSADGDGREYGVAERVGDGIVLSLALGAGGAEGAELGIALGGADTVGREDILSLGNGVDEGLSFVSGDGGLTGLSVSFTSPKRLG